MNRRFTTGGAKVHEILRIFSPEFISVPDLCVLTGLAPSSVTREVSTLRMTGVVILSATGARERSGKGWEVLPSDFLWPVSAEAVGYAFVTYEEHLRPVAGDASAAA